jgi:hypothetical protein
LVGRPILLAQRLFCLHSLAKILVPRLNHAPYYFPKFIMLDNPKRPHPIARSNCSPVSRASPAPNPTRRHPHRTIAAFRLACFLKAGDPVFILAPERCPSPASSSPASYSSYGCKVWSQLILSIHVFPTRRCGDPRRRPLLPLDKVPDPGPPCPSSPSPSPVAAPATIASAASTTVS